jgi:glycosyltransferase involved in cell wall biosynthesis
MGRAFHPYGQDVIGARARTVNADIVLSLLDAWIFDLNALKGLRWVPWFPIDHDPIPPAVLEKVRYAYSRIVYSKFGQKQLEDRDLPCFYVPHGVNADMFKPLHPAERLEARKFIQLPEDAFIVGMVAANKGYPSRKAFEQNIAAFKVLSDKHKDAVLFLQTMTGENGRDCVDLPGYCRAIGLQLGKNVFFCDQTANVMGGFPDQYMVLMYNSLDVLLSVSRGEGFGIPILEAQACGTPVITGDWTSMSELTFGGWKVDKKDTEPDFTQQHSYQFLPHVGAIADRLEDAYNMRGNLDYRKRARAGAEKYDARKVADKYWKPVLDQISQRIEHTEKLKAQAEALRAPKAGPAGAGSLDVKELSA